MQIHLSNIGKRYNQEWIFRGVTRDFISGNGYAVLGPNGSGKSTFLQVIAGNLLPSEGTIQHGVDAASLYRSVSIAAPYLELIEEFTLMEMLEFHEKFKSFMKGLSIPDVLHILELEKAKNKAIRYFSSGMKQRVRLALAILSDTSLLVLDEPTSNLDKAGVEWYSTLIKEYLSGRITIVGSNQQLPEYSFCVHHLDISDYK